MVNYVTGMHFSGIESCHEYSGCLDKSPFKKDEKT